MNALSSHQPPQRLPVDDLRDAWRLLDTEERVDGFRLLGQAEAQDYFQTLSCHDRADLVLALSMGERRLWMRSLAPDDAADVLQEAPDEERSALLELLDAPTRREVGTLLAYAEDDAGGLMSPRFARVRPGMTVDEAILYLRHQADQNLETIYYGYVLDREQRLQGVVSFRDLFQAKGSSRVQDVMQTELVTVGEEEDQEIVGELIAEHDLVAIPVIDGAGRMKGIVTVDDIVDVVQEEATEDIQKIGGSEALDAPYLEVGLAEMLKKRLGWLVILFLAQFGTAEIIAGFEGHIAQVAILATFIPLIMSSGGNSGSQATTLVIRSLALREVLLGDWLRVLRRELTVGLVLGLVLGGIGMARVLFFPTSLEEAGVEPLAIGLTLSCSVIGVVLWGTFSGSMLPFLLRRLGLDPASASAPLVATLVDLFGLLIYFLVAGYWLRGVLVLG